MVAQVCEDQKTFVANLPQTPEEGSTRPGPNNQVGQVDYNTVCRCLVHPQTEKLPKRAGRLLSPATSAEVKTITKIRPAYTRTLMC